jgi:hypothetical protein
METKSMKPINQNEHLLRRTLIAAAFAIFAVSAFGQGLNWEGQTGAFVTPFAYTSASSAGHLGHPQLAFHYLDGGSVVGNDFQISVTEGLLKRVEVGYTSALNASGSNTTLAPLFNNGFNVFHGKLNFLDENAGKQAWLPAVAVGFAARTQVRRVGGVLNDKDTSNGDFYLVATKTVTQVKHLPFVLNAGVKETDASLLGIAGNAPNWSARGFGALGLVLSGPAKSKIVVGSEVAQQPHYIQNLPNATLPTTLTYFARVIPSTEHPLNIDFGVAQAANRVLPGAQVGARAQFAFGISYRL